MARKLSKSKKPSTIIKCESCKKELVENNFYNSNSPLFPSGKVNICKKCILDMVNYDDMNSVYRMLQSLDIPFLYDYWDKSVEKNPHNPFGNYIRMANSLKQFNGLRYCDSSFDSSGGFEKDKSKSENTHSKTNKCSDELIYSDEWRGSYSSSDLDYLDSYYKDLKSDFKIVTRNHKDYARKIAKASLAMDKAYEDMLQGVQGADTRYKNLKDTFDQLSKSAQFAEDKRGANDVGLGCFGVIFDKVEKHNWIPKYEPMEKDDYDKLIEYFSTINKSL